MKNSKLALENKIFSRQGIFFEDFDFNKMSENEIEDNNQKICSQFSYKVSDKIDFKAHGLRRDHPPVWVFNAKWKSQFNLD